MYCQGSQSPLQKDEWKPPLNNSEVIEMRYIMNILNSKYILAPRRCKRRGSRSPNRLQSLFGTFWLLFVTVQALLLTPLPGYEGKMFMWDEIELTVYPAVEIICSVVLQPSLTLVLLDGVHSSLLSYPKRSGSTSGRAGRFYPRFLTRPGTLTCPK